MAAMMVIMVVILLVGPGHHFDSHDSHSSKGQEAQSYQHDTDKEKASGGNP